TLTLGSQAVLLINQGIGQRSTARTTQNDRSSRSHTVLTISLSCHLAATMPHGRAEHVSGSTRMRDLWGGDACTAKLQLVDLAGSERVGRLGRCRVGEGAHWLGGRLKEAGFINGSLSALGNVVAALGQAAGDRPHIPFRDSKLTRVLAESLGGNANAALIATVGPAPQNQAESLSTLLFASRCMRVKSMPVRKIHVDHSEEMLR
ncbi:unnamed protein product, partial [Discosporangium mesarthrocarpum]